MRRIKILQNKEEALDNSWSSTAPEEAPSRFRCYYGCLRTYTDSFSKIWPSAGTLDWFCDRSKTTESRSKMMIALF